jgi:predicted glycoside hydrolase/deacetylase ChbG (UPF0249 family)
MNNGSAVRGWPSRLTFAFESGDMHMKKLIVNADDFGYAAGVNRGILYAHHNGILTSTTVMVNYPHAAPGLEQALQGAPDLGLGLHVTLTSGKPVSAPQTVASLVNDDGFFYGLDALPERFADYDPDHIQREVAAQVARFVALAGQPPDHLDSHHHMAYLHPVSLKAMLEIARGYNIPLRNGMIDQPIDTVLEALSGILLNFEPGRIRVMVEEAHAVLADYPDRFWPARLELGFFADTVTLGDLLVILTNLPDDSITELMTHPGFVDESLKHSSYGTEREAEIEQLTHPATIECVRHEFIELITFGDIARPQPAGE